MNSIQKVGTFRPLQSICIPVKRQLQKSCPLDFQLCSQAQSSLMSFSLNAGQSVQAVVPLANRLSLAQHTLRARAPGDFKRAGEPLAQSFLQHKRVLLGLIATAAAAASSATTLQHAPAAPTPSQAILLWSTLTIVSIIFAATETAITKLSLWKIKEIAEEEGPKSAFITLPAQIASIRIAILLFTTAASIYKTPLIMGTALSLFPTSQIVITTLLTMFQLFFEELVPTSVAVANPKRVAQLFLPMVSRLSRLVSPVTTSINNVNNFVVNYFGFSNTEDESVSSDMLRSVTEQAEMTSGIKVEAGAMIRAVLDLPDNTVDKIMQPRVDIVALPMDASATTVLSTAVLTKYSRIPIYKGTIDSICGVVVCKRLLDCMNLNEDGTTYSLRNTNKIRTGKSKTTKSTQKLNTIPASSVVPDILNAPTNAHYRPQMMANWTSLTAGNLMERPLHIPDSMTCWTALQMMK